MRNAQALSHFVVKKSLADAVGLDPFAIDDELRNGALAGVADNFVGGAGRGFDVDFAIADFVLVEEALGLAAIGTVERGIDGQFHKRRL